jgi:hypothetical protein
MQVNCTETGTVVQGYKDTIQVHTVKLYSYRYTIRYRYRYTVYVERYSYTISLHCIGEGSQCRKLIAGTG